MNRDTPVKDQRWFLGGYPSNYIAILQWCKCLALDEAHRLVGWLGQVRSGWSGGQVRWLGQVGRVVRSGGQVSWSGATFCGYIHATSTFQFYEQQQLYY